MSTRKLILTALVCGLVIVVAGGIKLFQVASDTKQVEVLNLGTSAKLADMTVSVDVIDQSSEVILATVTMVGVAGANASEGWRLLAGGTVRSPIQVDDLENACSVTSEVSPVTCVVAFEPTDGSPTIAYIRGGAQSQWSK